MHILVRKKKLKLNDPRCYNGCFYDAEYVDGEWRVLEYNIPESEIQSRLDFWIDLNNYAVSQRGESARKQFKVSVE